MSEIVTPPIVVYDKAGNIVAPGGQVNDFRRAMLKYVGLASLPTSDAPAYVFADLGTDVRMRYPAHALDLEMRPEGRPAWFCTCCQPGTLVVRMDDGKIRHATGIFTGAVAECNHVHLTNTYGAGEAAESICYTLQCTTQEMAWGLTRKIIEFRLTKGEGHEVIDEEDGKTISWTEDCTHAMRTDVKVCSHPECAWQRTR
jgi:hypothetical protein